ncbi:hypothetical protein O6H91_04G103500 [Diphasiastrum complanatum]|uniref:Uncharacterized protein n=2 Tax=Diphasiastrum complanatum TaxID=34168 RepID=A0ACC2E081_DIPCM|nr:hypothetical protein O6H91_04G103500 [Diphasiastrum complanatum]KAJ7559851.1 hypothetical protein O6H91_04G103500 [Diphasiastrum complanatum]
MAGKRQRPIRRTVSASLMGSGSNIFESFPLPKYFKEKQKAPPVGSSCSPRPILASNNLGMPNPLKPPFSEADAISAPSQASPLFHKFEILSPPGWVDSGESKSVGLGVVSALSEESCAGTVAGAGAKDGKDETPSPVELQNSVMRHFAQQSILHDPPHLIIDTHKRSAVFLHESSGGDDDDDLVSMTLPPVYFLEACYFCKRRLSHGLDIYMYRGDQAFCTEECRHEQILLDERKENYSLLAIKMRTSAHPIQSTEQQSLTMISGTAAAG